MSRSLYRYRSVRPPYSALRERIAEIAADKRRYAYRRVYLRPRREGCSVNRKRVYRLVRTRAGRWTSYRMIRRMDGGCSV